MLPSLFVIHLMLEPISDGSRGFLLSTINPAQQQLSDPSFDKVPLVVYNVPTH